MSFTPKNLQDWETQVQKQLKTDDIYSHLSKPNLEGVQVRPFYTDDTHRLPALPRIEESTQLVCRYYEEADEQTFAFLLKNNVEGLEEKSLYVENKELAEHISVSNGNMCFSLIDVFSEDSTGKIDEQLIRELQAKQFERTICVDIALHQNAGASIVQQLAIALAKAKDLVEVAGPEILKDLIFRVAVGSNYFFEIAKIRALKLLFNQLSREFGFDLFPYIFAEDSLRNKSKFDPENNLIRSTLEVAGAMIAGADAVYCNDYLLENRTSLSQEISFKQQIVLAYESIINVFEDAAGGSYLVDDLTRQFAEQAWQLFTTWEENGGYSVLLKEGSIQKEIFNQAVAEQQWVAAGNIKLIGVNMYPQREATQNVSEMYAEDAIRPVRLSEMFE